MANIETEGLVLRSYNLSDADKIVVFITEEQGLIKGVAKGAKRLKSKFGSTLEPFSIVNLTYFQKEERELVNIRQIDLIRSHFKNTSEINFLNRFGYIAELLIEFVQLNDPNKRLYNMTKVCLETATDNTTSLEYITLYFEIWILSLCGFLPNWESCNNCKRTLNGFEETHFQFDNHLVCNDCQRYRTQQIITPTHREFYNLAQRVSPKKFIEITLAKKTDVIELSQQLKKIISKVLGKEFVGKRIFTAKY